ncbi:MAG TPA: methionyl-tRNA formyltransferase [Acholeplasma sp.]|nr:methionyl-tRNA formyltransferase [Acholeplasma sp.]
MKIIFMGTPSFAVPVLEEINKHFEIVLVVTQPDSRIRKKIVYSEVKNKAIELGLPIFQPENINKEKHYILNTECDLIVTAAYGQFLGKDILNHPKLAAINCHGSLLPKYRGGAPIQRAIMNGEKEIGVSIIYMTAKMDAGNILAKKAIPLPLEWGEREAFAALSNLGAKLTVDVIKKLAKEKLPGEKQKEEEVTFAPIISNEDELISFEKEAYKVYNKIRAINDSKGAYFNFKDEIYKVFEAKLYLDKKGNPGEIIDITKDEIIIACKEGAIGLLLIRRQGKNTTPVRDFLNGKGKEIFKIGEIIGG